MEPSTPFVDRRSETLDVQQILDEAVPVAKLVGLFVAVALVPFLFAVSIRGPFGALMMLVTQFVLAIGGALTLMYVIVRALQLADQQAPRAGTGRRAPTGTSAAGGVSGEAEDETVGEAGDETGGEDATAGDEGGDQEDTGAAGDGADAETDDGSDEGGAGSDEESDKPSESGEDADGSDEDGSEGDGDGSDDG